MINTEPNMPSTKRFVNKPGEKLKKGKQRRKEGDTDRKSLQV